jgi:DNA-binding transcriptional ArsR family regulator
MNIIENGMAEMALQPLRFKIIKILQKNGAMYLEQIAQLLQENPRLIAHHLEILLDAGLVRDRFDVITAKASRRKAVARFFELTPKASMLLGEIAKAVSMEGG